MRGVAFEEIMLAYGLERQTEETEDDVLRPERGSIVMRSSRQANHGHSVT